MTFQNAESNGVAAAFTVGSLLHRQHVKSQFACEGMTAGTIAEGAAAVAVKENFQRCAVPNVVIPSDQRITVKGGSRDAFAGIPLHDVTDSIDILRNGFILRTHKRLAKVFSSGWWRIENNAVDFVGNQQHNCNRGNADDQNGHNVPPLDGYIHY